MNANNSNQNELAQELHAPPCFIFIFGICTVAGILHLIKSKIKFLDPLLSLIMFFIGVAYGYCNHFDGFPDELNFYGLYELSPFGMHCIFLPMLLFDTLFAMDARTFSSLLFQVIILGVLGFGLIVTVKTLFVHHAFMVWYNWKLWICIMYASVTCLTDSTVILKLLKEIGSYKMLCRLLEGEAVVMVVLVCYLSQHFHNFSPIYHVALSSWNDIDSLVVFNFAQILAAPIFGYLIGRITVAWLMKILNDPVIEVVLVISLGYLTFLVGSLFNMSAVLAFMSYVLVLSDRRVCLYLGNDIYLQRIFEILKFMANMSIIALSGIQLTRQKAQISAIDATDVLMTLSLYFQAIFARGVLTLFLLPVLYFGGYSMSLPEGASIVWCEVPGAVTLLMAMSVCHSVLAKPSTNMDDPHFIFKLYFHICGMFVLSNVINGSTTTFVLDIFGMRHVPVSKRLSMSNAIHLLRDVIHTTLRAYRADRFLADADWEIVFSHVFLEIPYKSGYVREKNLEKLMEEVKMLTEKYHGQSRAEKVTVHLDAQDLSGSHETQDVIRDARLKVFRAKKASFWKQYQHGMLSLDAVRVLVESVDYARDEEEHMRLIEKSMKYCQVTGIFKYSSFMKRKFEQIEATSKELHAVTMTETKDDRIRKLFYAILVNKHVKTIFNIVLLINFLAVLTGLILMWDCTFVRSLKEYDLWLDNINYFVVAVYGFMVLCKVIAVGKKYFKFILHHVELGMVIIAYIDIILRETVFSKAGITSEEQLYCYSTPVYISMNEGYRKLLVISTVLLSTRFLRTFHLFETHYKFLTNFISQQLQLRLKLGYDIGKGYVTCVEEVEEILDNLIENKELRDKYREQLAVLRLSRMKELATLQKTYPGIVLSVKSQHAGRRILNNLNERIIQLRKEGMLDERESDKLEQMVAARLKLLLKIPADIPLPAAEQVLSEVPWVAGNQEFIEYIEHNAKIIGMAEGEVLDADSNPYGGLYVIISGLVRVDMYLQDAPQLPLGRISATTTSAKQQEGCSDYLTTGSTLGWMSLLTGVPHKTIATCETAVQLYHFVYEAVQAALELNVKHPSFEHQLWYTCALHVSYALLKKKPLYRNMAAEELKLVIQNGLLFVNPWTVPDGGKFEEGGIQIDLRQLSKYEFIIIFGTAVTLDGLETFRGPCIVPVEVEHIIFQPLNTDKFVVYVIPRDNSPIGSHRSIAEFGGSAIEEEEETGRTYVESFFRKSVGSLPHHRLSKHTKGGTPHFSNSLIGPVNISSDGTTMTADFARKSALAALGTSVSPVLGLADPDRPSSTVGGPHSRRATSEKEAAEAAPPAGVLPSQMGQRTSLPIKK